MFTRVLFRSLTISNRRGGSSKTTLTIHLAQYLALRGLKVLLIDLDAQASASHYLGLSPDRLGADIGTDDTMYSVLVGERRIEDVIRKTYWPGLSIVRSEEHTSELQSLMRISYAVICLKQKNIILTPN